MNLDDIDDKALNALALVWDAATSDTLRDRTDPDLLATLAAANALSKLAARAKTLAEEAITTHHTTPGWVLAEPGVGRISTGKNEKKRHDIAHAFTLVACRVLGDEGSPVDAVELPVTVKTIVDCCARLFTDSATLSLPAAKAQGIDPADVVRTITLAPKVNFTPEDT